MFFGVFRFHCLSLLLCGLLALPLAVRADVYDHVERLLRNGQLERAEQLSGQHLQNHPHDPQMRLLSSRLQDARGHTAQARETLQALTQEFPELPEPHNNLAVLLARQGQIQQAIDSLQRALQARPDYAQAQENLGDLYLNLARQAYLGASRTPNPSASASRKAEALAPLLPR
ncbi:MAG: tetratricopeptide repeat protein [Betaproteobacteria bacterium]|nr:tetratricopeptide repeat protein [Betaproteobacteria bacterium]